MLIFFELSLAINCRSLKYTLLDVKPHKLLVIAVLWEIVLALILLNVPAVLDAFGIAHPTMLLLGMAVGFGLIVLVSVEVMKHFLRTNSRQFRTYSQYCSNSNTV
jgi:Ca2+-transporting ATPase